MNSQLELFPLNGEAAPSTSGETAKPSLSSPAITAAAAFIEGRAITLGNLLSSDHAAEYVAILRAFVGFRAHHEPEPLHEDLEAAVCGEDADTDARSTFKVYLRQLKDWELITERIEKERLRGYRDTRRTKFRYRLCDDAVAFTEWLAEMRERDLNPATTDITGNLLDLQRSLVSELKRMLHRVDPTAVTYESASDVLYRVQEVNGYIENTARSLQELNLRLLGFVARDFSPDEAKAVVEELGLFLERFGRRFGELRDDIVRDIEEMRLERHQKRWTACEEKLREEAKKFRHVTNVRVPESSLILTDAVRFYGQEGDLSSLVNRVNDSARKVWGRLNAKLRELERRNHRLEDIGARLTEFAALDENYVPHKWMRRLISAASMRGDPQIRPGGEKSLAPKPKFSSHKNVRQTPCWITPRKVGERPDVASISQVRAERLKEWMHQAGIYPTSDTSPLLSSGKFATYEDCANIMRVIRATRLQNGDPARKRLSLQGIPTSSTADLHIATAELFFEDLHLVELLSV